MDPTALLGEYAEVENRHDVSGDRIAVYGATGHTGRLVATELARRGHHLVLSGRDVDGLVATAATLDTTSEVIRAELDDQDALASVAGAAGVLINCAGPYQRTGEPLAAAAVAHGCHYLGHAAEPAHIKRIYDTHADADVVVIPGMSFYGALADLAAAELGAGLIDIEEITVAYSVTGWLMTATSAATAGRLVRADSLVYRDNRFHTSPPQRCTGTFDFADPIGAQQVIENYPSGEIVTLPRHLATRSVRTVMTSATFADGAVFDSANVGDEERAGSAFTIEVHLRAPDTSRAMRLVGTDIYRTGALIAVEAATRLACDRQPITVGAVSPAQAFAPTDFLTHLPGLSRSTFTNP